MTDKAINQAFLTWADFLRPFAQTKQMDNILQHCLIDERKGGPVYPENENVFKAFKECPYNELKVVLTGIDPYMNGEASGLAYGLNPNFVGKCPHALRNIEVELLNSFPDIKVDYSLKDWPSQGILMLNTALTVREKESKSHLKYWQPFTNYVFEKLAENNTGIVYVLLGKETQQYKKFINKEANYILMAPHPAAEAYTGGNAGFFKSKIFTQLQKIILEHYDYKLRF